MSRKMQKIVFLSKKVEWKMGKIVSGKTLPLLAKRKSFTKSLCLFGFRRQARTCFWTAFLSKASPIVLGGFQ